MQLIKKIKEYFSHYLNADSLFDELLQIGDVFIIGGILREYNDCNLDNIGELRDADFAIKVHDSERWKRLLCSLPNTINRFGGHKFECAGLEIDVWDIDNTWAIKQNFVSVKNNNYVEALSNSVFLTVDSIIYDVKSNSWIDSLYKSSMDSKVLDIVLAENPYISLNVVRAMILKNKYKMVYSEQLKKVIKETSMLPHILDELCAIQMKRYGKIIISREKMEREFCNINNAINKIEIQL